MSPLGECYLSPQHYHMFREYDAEIMASALIHMMGKHMPMLSVRTQSIEMQNISEFC